MELDPSFFGRRRRKRIALAILILIGIGAAVWLVTWMNSEGALEQAIAEADRLGVAMLFTDRRVFRH